jgi:phosphoserine phosphatase
MRRVAACAFTVLLAGSATGAPADPLPSWHSTAPRQAIVAFIERVTKSGGVDFVAPSERIAVFDNDGTLWAEQPFYFQLAFALDRVKALANEHPEWKTKEPFASLLAGDLKSALAGGEAAILEIVMATHAGTTTDEFADIVKAWERSARHPVTKRRYTEMVYQPMLELLAYLRAEGFKTYIVSGGGVELMRVWSERVYGIVPEQVIGSTIVTKLVRRDGQPVLMREPKLDFLDDKEGKPVAINKFVGRRPIAAFGNSDGDLEMLEWTTAGDGPRFALIVHHTDAAREWAYDRESKIGRLDKALDAAASRKWTVVDMKNDWKTIYPE